MKQMTVEQAIKYCQSGKWKKLKHAQLAWFQLNQDLLCVDFQQFHAALERCLDRPIFTHEFINIDGLKMEFRMKFVRGLMK